MFKEIADIQTADTLNLPVPKANFKTIVSKSSDIQKEIVLGLGERAEAVRKREVLPNIDNMLKITNEGRKLALDQRMINEMLPDFAGSKINTCVKNVYEIWEKTKEKKSTQLIFCDLSTPNKNGKFNAYDDVKQKLIAKGIPENEIAFIHDADTETKKEELFAKFRAGEIRVLMGSTAKMGAGTNVQNKVKAIHHLDCPWRPADLIQRNGRGIRQGNENEEIDIFTYVTEGTFDAYLYQLVENKQKFISQIMTSKAIVRSAEDIDEKALSYAEIKALSAGNPLIVEKIDLDTQVARLKLLKQSYLSQIYKLEDLIVKYYPKKIRELQDRIIGIQKDIETVKNNTQKQNEEKFSPMLLKGKDYIKKEKAGEQILEICKAKENKEEEEIGEYRGLKMFLEINTFNNTFELKLKNNLSYKVDLGTDKYGNIARIDNIIDDIEKRLEQTKIELKEMEKQLETAKIDVEIPFGKEKELKEKSSKLDNINALLNLNEKCSEIIDDNEEEVISQEKEKKSQESKRDDIR